MLYLAAIPCIKSDSEVIQTTISFHISPQSIGSENMFYHQQMFILS